MTILGIQTKDFTNTRRAPLTTTTTSAATPDGATSSPRRLVKSHRFDVTMLAEQNAMFDANYRRRVLVADQSKSRLAGIRDDAVICLKTPATDRQFYIFAGMAAPMAFAIFALLVSAIPYL